MTRSTRARDIWLLSVSAHEATPLIEGEPDEGDGVFSPDGRWIAYVSSEAGPLNVYVRPLGRPGPPRRISAEGGSHPRWRRDGRELFYVSPAGLLMAVPILSRDTLGTGAAQNLFRVAVPNLGRGYADPSPYDVAPDGQRFLVAVTEREMPVLTLIQNWAARLLGRN
jgi:hypothetical protein